MAIAKVLEVIAESEVSWDDAAQNAVTEASKSVRNIKHLYVKDMQAIIDDGQIVKYRLNANLTFVVE
ncbi:MAG: dodecin family protein [Bacteroidota bacterium]